jgi:two-component sensor histidine kinase
LADSQGCGYAPSCSQCPLRLAVVDTLVNGARHEAVEVWLPSVGDGEPHRCLMVSTAAIFSGPHRKALVCAQDITKLQQTARQLQAVATEKTVLLKEVHHRVKNNLAVISSLLSMQSDIHASAEVSAALAQSQRRLQSMALIHEQLYGRDHLERVDFSEYAQQLVEEAYVAFVGEHARISLELAIDPIELGLDQAVPCALILNELLSNAFKHAFPGGRKGVIRISFRESEPGRLELAIQDDGIGSPPGHGESKPKSLGLSIVRILTAQLDGAFEQELCTGTRFVLRFPSGASRPPPRSLVA